MQEQFQTLLKRRLQAEIQHRPPLFPWETEISDYEFEASSSARREAVGLATITPQRSVAVEGVPRVIVNESTPASLWLAQLQTLDFPTLIPETILGHLLERCQTVVQSSLREGAKLIAVVDSLFPGQSSALNQLAGLVLTGATRSGRTVTLNLPKAETIHYDSATSIQKMVLSLLATRSILDSLTLTLSPQQPQVQRQWLTNAGTLTVSATYCPQSPNQLHVVSQLPDGGSIKLQGTEATATAQRSTPGYLSVELLDLAPAQTCPFQIQLQSEPKPLTLVIRPES